jgi:hypothetical protein
MLKEFCDKTLIRYCTTENALDLYGLACLHSLDEAKYDVQNFIVK